MATETWATPSSWTSAFTAGDANQALNNGSSLLSSTVVTNGTGLNIFADFSLTATAAANATAGNFVGVYLYPLNADGSSYGDGIFTASTPSTDTPSATYWVGNMIIPKATTAIKGMVTRIILPPGSFSFLVQNGLGTSANISANNSATQYQYRTYNRAIA